MPGHSAFFDAVRKDDVQTIRRLLADDPGLANLRWPGRSGDGKMRSLGPPPYARHTWLSVPDVHDACDPRFTSAPLIYTRNDEIVRLLVEADACVNAKGTSGDIETPDWFYTPLWRAAHDGRLASVRLLAARGADLDYRNPDGSNQALKTAAENDRLEVCKCLLDGGPVPDLITASMLGLADRVEAILAADRDAIHARDGHGRSALDGATLLDNHRVCHKGLGADHDRTAGILIAHGATVELEHAASLGWLERVRQLVEGDPELLTRPKIVTALIGGVAIMESPLRAAKRRRWKHVVAYLSERGALDNPPVSVR